MRKTVLPALVLILMTAGCTKEKSAPAKTMTERERHETLAGEPLPGATVVGRALDVNDRMDTRNARLNAQVDSLAR